MSVSTIYDAIMATARTVDGLKCPLERPGSLTSDLLPCALVVVGPGTWGEQAVGLKRQDRKFILPVYVWPLVAGEGPDDGLTRCLPLLQAVGNAFLAAPTLGGVLDQSLKLSDGGVRGNMTYGGTLYWGFEFAIDVVEKPTA
ncbi:MAG: hypothetical protein KKA73_25185 [Chloroflexi bacterium]|nr:hypothetical protein [Chloroflexota bacterium]MBU1750992.1 hypothetical protein [Chloroflexota bacterium]